MVGGLGPRLREDDKTNFSPLGVPTCVVSELLRNFNKLAIPYIKLRLVNGLDTGVHFNLPTRLICIAVYDQPLHF